MNSFAIRPINLTNHSIENLQKITQASNSTGISSNGTASSSNINAAAFKQAQQDLLNIQQNGINVRNNNQKLAQQAKSPAAVGVMQFGVPQVNEMTQVMSLTGSGGSNETNLLAQLLQEVQNDIKQNQMNEQVAQSQKC